MKEIYNLPLITTAAMVFAVATGCGSDSENNTSSTNDREQQEAEKLNSSQYSADAYNGNEATASKSKFRRSRDKWRSNSRPVADITGNHTSFSGETVTLDGSDSYDEDGDTLRYFWRQAKGPALPIDNRFEDTLTFVAPQVTEPTQFLFYLIVFDGKSADLTGFSLQISPVADSSPPLVSHRYPVSDQVDTPINSEVSVTFNEALSESSIDETSLTLTHSGSLIPGSVIYDDVSHSIIFSPNRELLDGTQYTVTIGEGVQDIAGNPALSESWQFVTAISDDNTDDIPDDGVDDNPDDGTNDNSDEGSDENPDDSADDNPDEGSDESPEDSADDNPDEGSDENQDDSADDNPDEGSDENPDDSADDNPDEGSDENQDDSADDTPDEGTGDNSGFNLGATTQDTIDACMDEADKQMLTLVNNARAQTRSCGTESYQATTTLAWNCQLESAAYGHSASMAENNFFSHTGEDGSSPGDRISDSGYVWRTYGENIAAGYRDAESVMDGWLTSPGHCANLMNANFKDIGVGIVNGSGSYGIYWTQDFAAQ
ncbi:MAG: CAP domain-containing protein [Candidatus Thiodiazotropha sp. 6PLUC2]